MKYDILPKRAFYRGVMFRSTLECNFACLFDAFPNFIKGWQYEKRRVDGYLPDFEGYFPAAKMRTVFVEIKPCVKFIETDRMSRFGYFTIVMFLEKNKPAAIVFNDPIDGSPIQDWVNNFFSTDNFLSKWRESISAVKTENESFWQLAYGKK